MSCIKFKFKSKEKIPEIKGYKLGKKLGEGQFAAVYLAWAEGLDYNEQNKLAIKVFYKRKLRKNADQGAKKVRTEIEILASLHHPNILKFINKYEDKKYLCIITEYMINDLFSYLSGLGNVVDETQARKWFVQLISAISYMHDNNIAHCDIKCDNLLLDKHMNLVVGDFGFSRPFNDGGNIRKHTAFSARGAFTYAAPEMFFESSYSTRIADIWSCGVVLFALRSGYLPWEKSFSGLNKYEEQDITYNFIKNKSLDIPDSVNERACDLIRGMLQIYPQHRFTMDQIKLHEWTRYDSIICLNNPIPFPSLAAVVSSSMPQCSELPELHHLGIGHVGASINETELTSQSRNSLLFGPIPTNPAQSDSVHYSGGLLVQEYRLWPLCSRIPNYVRNSNDVDIPGIEGLIKIQYKERLKMLNDLNPPINAEDKTRFLRGEGLYPYKHACPEEISRFVYNHYPPILSNEATGIHHSASHHYFNINGFLEYFLYIFTNRRVRVGNKSH